MGTAAVIICTVVIAVLAISIGLIASSLKKLDTKEMGIKYDVHLNKLGDTAQFAGMHSGPPGFKFIIFPRVYQTVEFSNVDCLNKDGISITVSVQFQYLVNNTHLKEVIMKFRDHDNYEIIIKAAGTETIHSECSKFTVTDFQLDRTGFQTNILNSLRTKLVQNFYTDVRDVQVKNIARPSAYDTIVRDKEAAKQNIAVALEERPRVLTAAITKKKAAETQANITLDKANIDARIMITKANADAEGIKNAYETEAETYSRIMTDQNLSTEALLSYLSIRAIQQSKASSVYVNLDTPAKTSFP